MVGFWRSWGLGGIKCIDFEGLAVGHFGASGVLGTVCKIEYLYKTDIIMWRPRLYVIVTISQRYTLISFQQYHDLIGACLISWPAVTKAIILVSKQCPDDPTLQCSVCPAHALKQSTA